MRKLALKLDDLVVDSFILATPVPAEGTVEAHASNLCTEGHRSCDVGSCPISCFGSCPCDPQYPESMGCEYPTLYESCNPCDLTAASPQTCVAPCHTQYAETCFWCA
jgi:hypothetical protein